MIAQFPLKILETGLTGGLMLLTMCAAGCVNSPAATSASSLTGAWSEPVLGLRGRLALEKGEMFNGLRTTTVYLELQNSQNVLNPRQIYYDEEQVACSLLDEAGHPLDQVSGFADEFINPPYWIALPMDSALRFRISVTGFVPFIPGKNIAGGLQISLARGNWVILPDSPSDAYLSVSLLIKPPPPVKDIPDFYEPGTWHGELKLPPLKIPAQFVSGHGL